MLKNSERILKFACLVLGLLTLFQLARVVARSNPLARLSIPALPSLPAPPEAVAGGKGTNSQPAAERKGTNSVAPPPAGKSATNAPAAQEQGKTTNALAVLQPAKPATNTVAPSEPGPISTNSVAVSNSAGKAVNSALQAQTGKGGSNSIPPAPSGKGAAKSGPRPDLAKKDADLAAPIKNRIERITESEILGPVMRPMPMALLGIAGPDVFLRAPDGQTGLVKEGAELGGVKLLRVGINRVLIELEGKKQELTIFSGFGSETLLEKEPTNEPTIKKSP